MPTIGTSRLKRVGFSPNQPRSILGPLAAAALTGAGFAIRYLNSPVVPHASGDAWHRWSDQSEYMRSAFALSSFSFASDQHHYPLFYSLFAAPFMRLLPNDPFLVVDLISICMCAGLLTVLFRRDCGSCLAVAFSVLSLAGNGLVAQAFIVPWTSTLAMPFILASLVIMRWADDAFEFPARASFLLGLLIGLIFLTRPLDGLIIGAALAPFWMLRVYRQYGLSFRHAVAFGGGGLIGPLASLISNLVIHHQALSPYMRGHATRLVIQDIPEKLVSLFLDSEPLYLEAGQTIFAKFPWMVIALPAMAICLALGNNGLRAAVAAIALFAAAYASFDDLIPNVLFRYGNYHYLRWLLVMAPMMAIPAVALWRQASPATRVWTLLMAASCFLPAFVVLKTADRSVPVMASGQLVTIKAGGAAFDYVDISPASAAWEDVFFDDPQVQIDGRKIRHDRRDVRMLPAGQVIRVLFNRPEAGQEISLNVEKLKIDPHGISARLGSYYFGFGFPRWLN